ncbi:MAG TPA: vitamin K epoxide reductase family protein [Ktedonobacteraceae bacterium]|jgi:uncharacterized membrane protein|nr:vitamin K epoxide reductase family protein [Ktedonobacteraceae bacterium]
MNIRRSRAQAVLLALSLVSVVISIYLTIVHYQGGQVACTTGGIVNCERVLSSLYSVVPGTQIPISLPGLLWFAVAAVIAAVGLRQPQLRLPRISMFVWTLLGMLTVLYLVYVEIVRLDAICLWCTSLHIIIFIMFLMSVIRLQAGSSDAEEYDGAVPEKEVARR